MSAEGTRLARLVAGVGGIGAAPVAPGTVASLAAVLAALPLLAVGHVALLLGFVLVSACGWLACRHSGAADTDPGWIVIDEVAGQFLAVAALPRPGMAGAAAAFLLFRLFDILKPWPASAVDRRRDATGIMGDDVVAGGMAALVLLGARLARPGWFAP